MTAKCHVCQKPEGQEHESWCSVAPDRVQGKKRECKCEKCRWYLSGYWEFKLYCEECKSLPIRKDNWQPLNAEIASADRDGFGREE